MWPLGPSYMYVRGAYMYMSTPRWVIGGRICIWGVGMSSVLALESKKDVSFLDVSKKAKSTNIFFKALQNMQSEIGREFVWLSFSYTRLS